MILFKQASELSHFLSHPKNIPARIGFVPTMGALHDGHLSLIRAAQSANDLTVCSIFVNPTQFNNADDYNKYPITIDRDVEMLLRTGCDVLFLPSTSEIYPPGYRAKHYDLGWLETVLEGAYRPGHFQGVCQVVDRLLEICRPHNLYVGAKDYQQCKVIGQLLNLLGKEAEINLHVQPTLREADGLAMSSRNLRLNLAQRKQATTLHALLQRINQQWRKTDLRELEANATAQLNDEGFRTDYVQIADAETLLPASADTAHKVALVAAYIGEVRLIDNLMLS